MSALFPFWSVAPLVRSNCRLLYFGHITSRARNPATALFARTLRTSTPKNHALARPHSIESYTSTQSDFPSTSTNTTQTRLLASASTFDATLEATVAAPELAIAIPPAIPPAGHELGSDKKSVVASPTRSTFGMTRSSSNSSSSSLYLGNKIMADVSKTSSEATLGDLSSISQIHSHSNSSSTTPTHVLEHSSISSPGYRYRPLIATSVRTAHHEASSLNSAKAPAPQKAGQNPSSWIG